jgi:hypothetical protein
VLEISDFTLGMPQQAMVETLGKHLSTVDLVDSAYYQGELQWRIQPAPLKD